MNGHQEKPAPGLYFVATPIGAARDITLRTLDLLGSADLLAAEDTRTLRRLMEIHGVSLGDRPLIAYHDHNGERVRPRILAALAAGKSVVYASEAGTPLIADPGFQLGRAAIDGGHPVFSAPGPSAALAALTVSGLPSDRFTFAGFPPTGTSQRASWLSELQAAPATLIFYESPRRVHALLEDLRDILGPDRRVAVCRELTKRFEEVSRGTAADLAAAFAGRAVKGEIVVVVDRPAARQVEPAEIEAALKEALQSLTTRDAAAQVAERLGLPRRRVYQMALALASGD